MDDPRMKRFVVRANCEYSIAVEAVDESEALQKADVIPLKEWDTAWSEREAEPESESEVCDECRSYGPGSNCDCRR
jgi:hypothetical protein